jgi:hypothetical protein
MWNNNFNLNSSQDFNNSINNCNSSEKSEVDLELEKVGEYNPIDIELYKIFPRGDKVLAPSDSQEGSGRGGNVILNNYGSIGQLNINTMGLDSIIKQEMLNTDYPILDLEKLDRLENSNRCQDEMKELLNLQLNFQRLIRKTKNDLKLYLSIILDEISLYIKDRKKNIEISLDNLDKELSLKLYTEEELKDLDVKLKEVCEQALNIIKDFTTIK